MHRTPALLLAPALLLLAGCGGGQPTQPAEPPATAAATSGRPSAGPTPTGANAPGGTATGRTLTFRNLTIRLQTGWKTESRGDQVTVTTGAPCKTSSVGVDCPGFTIMGPSEIATANEGSPYTPDEIYHPGSGVEGCPIDRDRLAEQTPSAPVRAGFARLGIKTAVYREWEIGCRDQSTGAVTDTYVQRLWYLPRSRILIVDEWSVPELPSVLAAAHWSA